MQFRGPYAFLSNMYHCTVIYDGIKYPCSETAFQAQKYKIIFPNTDLNDFAKFDGKEAKRITREFSFTQEQKEFWEANRVSKMYFIVLEKFLQNEDLMNMLLFTDTTPLVEDNTWGDRFWGVDQTGQGLNMLGEILMRIRKELKEELDGNDE